MSLLACALLAASCSGEPADAVATEQTTGDALAGRPSAAVIEAVGAAAFGAAGSTLRGLGMPARSAAEGPPEHRAADGTSPETIGIGIRSLEALPALRTYYAAACARAGLATPPPADAAALEPDLLCEGRKGAETLQVLVAPCLDAARCTAYLEVRSLR